MPINIEKEWAAVDDDDKIVMRAGSKESLKSQIETEGYSLDDLNVVALPKSQSSMFI